MEKRQHEKAKYIITANRSSMVPFLISIGNTYSLSASKILQETPMALCSTKNHHTFRHMSNIYQAKLYQPIFLDVKVLWF